MYYPIGWHKVLKLDIERGDFNNKNHILQIQANNERELFFILTSFSLHIWFPKPAAEIVCHKRSKESIERIGPNKSAIWKTDSSVIVVATENDQLLFYQIKRRATSSTATSFLLPASLNGGDGIYRLKYDSKNTKRLLNGNIPPDAGDCDQIPALTIFSFGKLDLSSVGVSCLMAAEEELVVGSRRGDMYGVQWDGNVDDKFPWSLSKQVRARADYLIDLKFSSVLSGFALVFKSGRVGFMPLKLNDTDQHSEDSSDSGDTNITYLAHINDAACVEINHRYRLVAFGLKSSKVIVCNIGDNHSTLEVNHILQLDSSVTPHDVSCLGSIKSMSYSPDNAALAVSWQGGNFAVWSVFGSLLFCSQQWQQECDSSMQPIKAIQVGSLDWDREGYNLWLCSRFDSRQEGEDSCLKDFMITTKGHQAINTNDRSDDVYSTQDRVLIMALAHCNLTSSPHSTCSSDSIVLMAENKIFVGPSVPHEDKFDHWIMIDVAHAYPRSHPPIKHATVDRNCKKLSISGIKGIAVYFIESGKWCFLSKKVQDSFTVCGDLIWWHDYLIASCFNFVSQSFEIRAYATGEDEGPLDSERVTVQPTRSEIVRMSVFENRLLVLYVDGTLGMFMLNLRRKPTSIRDSRKKPNRIFARSNSTASKIDQSNSNKSQTNDLNATECNRATRSDSVVSWSHYSDRPMMFKNTILQISPIENLIISNLQANSFCISSIALTRLHFKNNRQDDSILLNACGKLFLLEREVSFEYLIKTNPNSNRLAQDNDNTRDLPQDDTSLTGDDTMKINSPTAPANSIHLASASLRTTMPNESGALSNVTFKAVSVIATNVEQFWISPEISSASELSYFRRSLWLLSGNNSAQNTKQNKGRHLQVWLPLLNDEKDLPNDLYVPDRIMLPVRCDIYPLAIRSSSTNHFSNSEASPDDAIVLGAESDILYRDCQMFKHIPYTTVKRQCRVYLHRILRELLLSQHLGYYAKKIAEGCQSLPYFAHCFELLLHEVLEEEATSPVPLPDPMLPQVVKFIKQFPQVYLETVVHCARKSELSMWSHLFDERAVGNPRRLFQECLDKQKLDTAASCLIILQSLDRNIVSSRMVKELKRSVKESEKFSHLLGDLEGFLSRAELDRSMSESPGSTGSTTK